MNAQIQGFRCLATSTRAQPVCSRVGGEVAPRRARDLSVAVRAQKSAQERDGQQGASSPVLLSSTALKAAPALWLASAMPAQAYEFQGSYSSYYVTLGLFLMTAPGLWSLIKRAPKAAVKRQTFEIDGPKVEGAKPLDDVARGVAAYFLKYNYNVAGTGEVITFEGTYQASKSQAFAITTYTLFSLASIALVLSIVVPDVGNWWYSMVLLSPLAGYYYWSNGDRQEQVKVKMVTADDEMTTDIIVEGDKEELERFAFELGFVEKGKVRVKGVLEG